jgi:hypothetical protein
MDFPVQRPGLFVGLGWFEACLSGRVSSTPFGDHLAQLRLPPRDPAGGGKGDRIRVRARLEERRSGYRVRWEGAISGRRGTVRLPMSPGKPMRPAGSGTSHLRP